MLMLNTDNINYRVTCIETNKMEFEDLTEVLQESDQVIRQCFTKFQLSETFICFNGGKDCTVLLDLTINVLKDMFKRDVSKDLNVVYIRSSDPFREIENFINVIKLHYDVNLIVTEGEIKEALRNILDMDSNLKACLLGTRRTDPYSKELKFMQKTDPHWPQVLRVSPLLNWNYHQIWSYILQHKLPYCELYNIGYTSLGSTKNTKPNPSLAYKDKFGCIRYHPAWKLTDASLERSGRETSNKIANGHASLNKSIENGHS